MEVKQVVVVEHVGGDEGIGAHRVCHLGVETADVIGACHPIGIQHRVSRDLHLGAGGIVPGVGHIVPATEPVAVLAGGGPLRRKLHYFSNGEGVAHIRRAGEVTQTAVGAVQPDGAALGDAHPEGHILALGAGHPEAHIAQILPHIGRMAELHSTVCGGDGGSPPSGGGYAVVGAAVIEGMQVAGGTYILDRPGAAVVGGDGPQQSIGVFQIGVDLPVVAQIHLHRIAVSVDGIGVAAVFNIKYKLIDAGDQPRAVIRGGCQGLCALRRLHQR